jgi:hypothetical protein
VYRGRKVCYARLLYKDSCIFLKRKGGLLRCRIVFLFSLFRSNTTTAVTKAALRGCRSNNSKVKGGYGWPRGDWTRCRPGWMP